MVFPLVSIAPVPEILAWSLPPLAVWSLPAALLGSAAGILCLWDRAARRLPVTPSPGSPLGGAARRRYAYWFSGGSRRSQRALCQCSLLIDVEPAGGPEPNRESKCKSQKPKRGVSRFPLEIRLGRLDERPLTTAARRITRRRRKEPRHAPNRLRTKSLRIPTS